MEITLQRMQAELADRPEIRFSTEKVCGLDVVIACYMVANKDLWENPYAREARGSVFDAATGECISRPFEKFFNLGERADSQLSAVQEAISDSYMVEVMTKADGSMITPVCVNGRWLMKTKKSFYSDVAQQANAYWREDVNEGLRKFVEFMDEGDYTVILEYMSPENKVVIDYPQSFKILAVRHIPTGAYMRLESILKHAADYGITDQVIAGISFKKPEAMLSVVTNRVGAASYVEDIEGWVVRVRNFDSDKTLTVKIKTDWYNARHRMLDVRTRDIAELVFDDKLDDMRSEFLITGCNMEAIDAIESEVNSLILRTVDRIELLATGARGLNRKGMDRVNWVKTHAGIWEKIVFRMVNNSQTLESQMPMVIELLKRNHLAEWNLNSVSNSKFGAR